MSEPKITHVSGDTGGNTEPRDHGDLGGEQLTRVEDSGYHQSVPPTELPQAEEKDFVPNEFRGDESTQDAYRRGKAALDDMRTDADLPYRPSPEAKLPERKRF